jgi:hypothetical protein
MKHKKGKKYDEEKLGREKERIHLFLKFRSEEKMKERFQCIPKMGPINSITDKK